MPGDYIDAFCTRFPEKNAPCEARFDTNIMVDLGSTIGAMCQADTIGKTKLTELLEKVLAEEYDRGAVLDAVVA